MNARYEPGSVRSFVETIATKVGVPMVEAGMFAEALVDADVHGVSTHGVSRLAIYIQRIQQGLIDPAAQLEIDRTMPSVLAMDAGNGLGQVQAVKALEFLIPLARKQGVAAATIRRSQHFGALSYYCNMAAEHDAILLAMTNCEPAMSAEGACQAFFGTNPIAASFPTHEGFPVKIDLATSVVARGNIIAAQKAGQAIPEGWALDSDGNPTTDAASALAGTVLTMAGHKGYALALLVEVLAGVLSGAAVGREIGSMYKHMDRPQNVGHFFCLIDIAAFMEVREFKNRLGLAIKTIKGSRKRPDVREILVPGERSHRTAVENRRIGVAIDQATLGEFRRLAGEFDIPLTITPIPLSP